ncbi:VPLPA-CTERM sorting domain-containing protein [Celeribacter arenosi]|uniref:VPLPA-CTERM protein sorting domain-containing protein n=1 Tax=Celeribacter arenosi TaxID=792649 RepID=A0ABP7KEM0_9RHOB
MKFTNFLGAALLALGVGSAAEAATVKLDFSSGTASGSTYVQDGFTITVANPTSISTSNDCGSSCLKLSNNQSALLTFSGGAFNIMSFLFNGKGNDGAFDFSYDGGAVTATYTESNNGNTMTLAEPNLTGVTSVLFVNKSGGSSRIDDINVSTISEVPLPASGLLLLAGLGGLAMKRRRKS